MNNILYKREFEMLISENIGMFSLEERNERQYEYRITNAINPIYQNYTFSIFDEGIDGITVTFYNTYLNKFQRVEHIYHWSDAYQVLYMGLTMPENIRYKDLDQAFVSVAGTLGKAICNFEWKPVSELNEIDDDTLETAIELVKYNYIDSELSYDEEENIINIHGAIDTCNENSTYESLIKDIKLNYDSNGAAELEKGINFNIINNGMSLKVMCTDVRCGKNYCFLHLCGYIEYLVQNDSLYEKLEERRMKRAEYRTPCGPYKFTWKPEGGLRYIDESIFNLAEKIVDSGLIKIEDQLTEDNKITIWTDDWIFTLNEEEGEVEVTTCSMLDAILKKENKCDPTKNWITHNIEGSLKQKISIDGIPDSNLEDSYVYLCAAYIKYLKDCSKESVIESDREWYKQNRGIVIKENKTSFGYELSECLFMDVSKEEIEIAEELQENNMVAAYRNMLVTEDNYNYFRLRTFKEINDAAKNLNELKYLIKDNKIESYSYWTYNFYDWVEMSKEEGTNRVIILAGYIDYLKRTGQYEEYKKQMFMRRQKTEENFVNSQGTVPKLGKVLTIAKNDKESSLYCVIEGERGIGKRKVVEQIATLLAQQGKIKDANYECKTFEDLASALGVKCMHNFPKEFPEEVANTYENQFSYYDGFQQKKLYVLNDLKEFIGMCQKASGGDGSKISHLIKLLGRYQTQTFIIIIGEKKYVDQLMEISPQIKFLFGNNIISMNNLSAEELYNVFAENLSEDLKIELNKNLEFRNKFLDYMALNRKLLPLNNQELANYLAHYANIQKDLVLPPSIYRKQSAKEMFDSVIGMENVKQSAYKFEKYAIFLKRAEMDGMSLPNSNMHMIFTGNPGTGKTMIARIIGQMLFDLGIIEENKVFEIEPKDLKSPYIGESAIKTSKIIDKAMGGVLFVDEAYAIGNDSGGKEAIATLIKAMEDHKDKFVAIFAGYEKEMHEFLNINSGITSRIGYTFHFDDYSVDELTKMFDVKMKKAGFTYNEDILNEVRELCITFSRRKNFGNGRFIDKVIQNVIIKHSSRDIDDSTLKVLEIEDIPSASELTSTAVIEQEDYEKQLDNFIGMDNVKNKVRQFADYIMFREKAKRIGAKIPDANMHMIFTGNPGTGKTTIARIMVDMLYSIGIIKENKLIEVERKDLVAGYIGQTAAKTSEVIERALGGVLFIDEAYTLAPSSENDFAGEAIATLIKSMEDNKSDLIVIFAGYKDEMRNFINSNPGIESRIGNVFDFEDYKPEELLNMYEMKMQKAGFTLTKEAKKKAKIVFEYYSKKKNFGNGRFVGKYEQETMMLRSKNVKEEEESLSNKDALSYLLKIDEKDIPGISDLNNKVEKVQKDNELDKVIGMTNVKKKIQEFEALVKFKIVSRERGLTVPDFNMHMLFTGNPGTGKTSIARIIAKKLYDIGVIMENKLVEVERKDLVAGYIGQTAAKVSEVIEKAMGGILFIDEAYTLTPKSAEDFGGEAIATLIKAMEDHKDDLIVIFAGYKDEMKEFTEANPGIASRIGFTFHFEDYTAHELLEIYLKKMNSNGFVVKEDAKDKLLKVMQYFCNVKNFGNGRFVDRIIQNTITKHALGYNIDEVEQISEKDIPDINEIINIMGNEECMISSDVINDEEHRRIAVHEIGHAVVQKTLFKDSTIKKITINAEGNGNLGYVEHDNNFGVQNTKATYKNSVIVYMAGLAAEKMMFGDYADGGSSDIKAASNIVHDMITKYGMSKYGFVGSGNAMDTSIEINEVLKDSFDSAIHILEANKEGINKSVELLLEKGEINDSDIGTRD